MIARWDYTIYDLFFSFRGGHFENNPKWRVDPKISNVNILVLNQESPLNKMIPFVEVAEGVHGDPSWPMDYLGHMRDTHKMTESRIIESLNFIGHWCTPEVTVVTMLLHQPGPQLKLPSNTSSMPFQCNKKNLTFFALASRKLFPKFTWLLICVIVKKMFL